MSLTLHPEDARLNEYLDGRLSPLAQADLQTHLAACAACARRLKALEAVFDLLAALPEETLERDLSGAVRTALQAPRPGTEQVRAGFWALIAVEAGLGLLLLILTGQPQIFQNLLLGVQQGAGRAVAPLLLVCGRLLLQWQSLSHLAPDGLDWLTTGVREVFPAQTVVIGLILTALVWLTVHVFLLKASSHHQS